MRRCQMFRFALAIAAFVLGAGAWGVPSAGQSAANRPVASDLRAGEARIWYLGHCGFAVRTAQHLLIFDYQERRDGPQPRTRPDTRGLDRGWVDPAEIAGDRVRVFVSHSHDDHFDPVTFGWKQTVPDIAYYLGWKAAADPWSPLPRRSARGLHR